MTSNWIYYPSKQFPNVFMVLITSLNVFSNVAWCSICKLWLHLVLNEKAGYALGRGTLVIDKSLPRHVLWISVRKVVCFFLSWVFQFDVDLITKDHNNLQMNVVLFWWDCNTDLLLLCRLAGGVGQFSVRLDPLCCRTAPGPVPLCSDWARHWWLYWLMWTLWELKQKPSSISDGTMLDSGVSASGGREMSSGDAQSYSSLEK